MTMLHRKVEMTVHLEIKISFTHKTWHFIKLLISDNVLYQCLHTILLKALFTIQYLARPAMLYITRRRFC